MSASRARLDGKFSRLEAHLFINVVITRVILFCPAVPPSLPSAPSLVPRNATSFVSLLAKLLVLRARLFLPVYARSRARENESERERERERVFSHERARSSCPLALPFVSSTLSLSFSSFLSFLYREAPSWSPSFLAQLSLFLSFSISCPCVLLAVLSLTSLSSVSLIFLLFPRLLLSRWFSSYSALSFFFSSVLSFCRGWLFFHPSSHQREYFSPSAAASPPTVHPSLLPLSSSFFVPVDRGVLHSSNLNAGRTGVLYRLRK